MTKACSPGSSKEYFASKLSISCTYIFFTSVHRIHHPTNLSFCDSLQYYIHWLVQNSYHHTIHNRQFWLRDHKIKRDCTWSEQKPQSPRPSEIQVYLVGRLSDYCQYLPSTLSSLEWTFVLHQAWLSLKTLVHLKYSWTVPFELFIILIFCD